MKDRMLQRTLDEEEADEVLAILDEAPELRSDYEMALRLASRLTNPLVAADLRKREARERSFFPR